ncbi:hypothetical protein [Subtercola lobariae]|nr:hypothetical protein [Subtercola lobariae]
MLFPTKGTTMIQHTIVFSFTDRQAEEQDAFIAEIRSICLDSGLATDFVSTRHIAAPTDEYARVFVSSAMVRMTCESLKTLEQLAVSAPLLGFQHREQDRKPYGVVWINHAPLA